MRTLYRIAAAAVALVCFNLPAEATLLTDAEVFQLERMGGVWADAATVHGMGIADRIRSLDVDGSMTILDDEVLRFGTDNNFSLGYDEASDDALELLPLASGNDFIIGTASLLVDILHYGDLTLDGATSGYDIAWDRSDNALEFADLAELGFGTGANGNCDMKFVYAAAGTLTLSQETDGTGKLVFGQAGANGMDIDILSMTAGDKITFDAGDKQLSFVDCTVLMGLDDPIYFGDTAVSVFSDDDGYLDLVADAGIRASRDVTLAANMDLNMSGTATLTTGTGAIALNGDITVAGAKDIQLAAGAGYFEELGATSGGIRISAIDSGTGITTINNSAGTPTITLPATTCTLPGLGLGNVFTVEQFVTFDDTTNGVVDTLTLTHSSSDNHATALDGVAVTFNLENATGTSTVEEWASIDVLSTNITNDTEEGDFVFSQMTAGAVAETLRLVANSTATTADYLQWTANTTEDNLPVEIMRLVTEVTGGQGASGLGASINVYIDDATAAAASEAASIDFINVDGTSTSEDCDIVFSAISAGTVYETLRLVSNVSDTTGDRLQYTQNTTETNGVIEMMRLVTEVAGAAGATGLGSSINVYLDDATAAVASEAASIDFVLTDGTNAQEDSDIVFSTLLNAAVMPALTIDASDQSVTLGQNLTDPDGIYQLRIFPVTGSKGSLVLAATASAGDTVTTITNASQAAGRTYTIPDSGATASEFLLTDRTKTKWSFVIGGVNGEDTDGVLTHTGGIAGGSKPTGVTQTEAAAAFAVVDDGGVMGTLAANTYGLFPAAPAAGDALYLGAALPFCELGIDMSATLCTYDEAGVLVWEYSKGSSVWGTLVVNNDNTGATGQTGAYFGEQDGAFTFVPPADWASDTVNSQAGYWIRAVIQAEKADNITQVGVTDSKEHLVVTPDGDAVTVPYKCNISKVRVTNLGATVHNQIIKFVLMNFTKGTYSLELSWAASQQTDTWTTTALKAASAGVDCDAGDALGILITEDNGSTVNPGPIQVELDVTLTD